MHIKIEFTVRCKPTSEWSMNSIYSGSHWSKRKHKADQIHRAVYAALKQAGIPRKPLPFPVRIHIRYNSRLDIDNHGYLAKLIVDGIKGWIVKDDSRRYVKELVQSFHEGKVDFIYVTIEEVHNA